MKNSYHKFLGLSFFLLLMNFSLAADAPNVLSLIDLFKIPSEASRKLLYIEGKNECEKINPDSTSEKVVDASFCLTFDVFGGGRMKYEYNPLILPWSNGGYSYNAKRGSYVYNGKYWIEAINEFAPVKDYDKKGVPNIEKFQKRNIAVITSSPPPYISSGKYSTGIGYLLAGADFEISGKLWDFKSLLTSPDAQKVSIKSEGENILVSFVDVCTSEKIWIDVRRKCLVRQVTERNLCNKNGIKRKYEINIERFEEKGGCYFPAQVNYTIYESGVPVYKYLFVAKKIELIDELPDTFNPPKVAEGWLVKDQRFGVEFRVGKDNLLNRDSSFIEKSNQ